MSKKVKILDSLGQELALLLLEELCQQATDAELMRVILVSRWVVGVVLPLPMKQREGREWEGCVWC